MIEIDGSQGEGGGQILRTTLALAAVLGKEVRIFNIRAGRSEPGLKAQHLTGAKAVGSICNAKFQGLAIGSTELVFRPERIDGGKFYFDVATAGSITLVLQAVMPLLAYAHRETVIEIRGGTDVKWSPPIDYIILVLIPLLSRMGLHVAVRVISRGHFPKGGGVVKLTSSPSGSIRSIEGLKRGAVKQIVGVSHAVRLPRHVAERQALAATRILEQKGWIVPSIDIEVNENHQALSPGCGIVLCLQSDNTAILGGDSLGERGVPAEEVGQVAAQTLIEEVESGSYLDRHAGDMIVPFIGLAEGFSDLSVSRITQHALTNVSVTEKLAGVHFDPIGNLGSSGRLRVKGLGLRSSRPNVSSKESPLFADS